VDEYGRTSPLAALEQLRMRIRTRHYSYRTECCRTASANSVVRSPQENCTIGAPGVWMPDALRRNFFLIPTTTWFLGLGGESSVEMADADRLTARDGSGDPPAHGAGGPAVTRALAVRSGHRNRDSLPCPRDHVNGCRLRPSARRCLTTRRRDGIVVVPRTRRRCR